jgi:hypothetical protein
MFRLRARYFGLKSLRLFSSIGSSGLGNCPLVQTAGQHHAFPEQRRIAAGPPDSNLSAVSFHE